MQIEGGIAIFLVEHYDPSLVLVFLVQYDIVSVLLYSSASLRSQDQHQSEVLY